jgi:hypothetical protein
MVLLDQSFDVHGTKNKLTTVNRCQAGRSGDVFTLAVYWHQRRHNSSSVDATDNFFTPSCRLFLTAGRCCGVRHQACTLARQVRRTRSSRAGDPRQRRRRAGGFAVTGMLSPYYTSVPLDIAVASIEDHPPISKPGRIMTLGD